MLSILIAADLTEDTILKMSHFGELYFIEKGDTILFDKKVMIENIRKTNPDIIVVDATPVDKEIIDCAENLKCIHCTRGNPVNIDIKYCRERGILVGNSPGRNANAVAEFTFGLIINLMRKISFANRRVLKGEFLLQGHWEAERERPVADIIWNRTELPIIPYQEFQSNELSGKTLGLIGFGAIGKLIADLGKAFHVNIVVYDPYIRTAVPDFVKMVSLDELAAISDIISLHAKETDETVGMINKSFFKKMKSGSYLINTSRGKLIDREAMMEALQEKKLAGAALDVFDYEPLCKDDPLLSLDNLLITPHIGGASKDVILHHSNSAIENIESYFKNGTFVHSV